MLFLNVLASAAAAAAAPAASTDTAFLSFPYVEAVSAAKAPAFVWLMRQGERTSVHFAQAPRFSRVPLVSRTDVNGDPITDVQISPDGSQVVYVTGSPRSEAAFNPASLLQAPEVTLWLIAARAGAESVEIGPGREPSFSSDGRLLLFKRGGDLWSLETRSPRTPPKIFAKGGAGWSQLRWSDTGDLLFIEERAGYSFLGRFRSGTGQIEWLLTGAERLAMPVLSPSGDAVAVLRLPGRKHSMTYDQTEAEPFSIDLMDLASKAVRTIWSTRGPAINLGMDDPETALRWVSNDRLVFYSEDDGWGRLYSLARSGGKAQPLTPGNCMVAESEAAGSELLVIHNCKNLDSRQMSLVRSHSGAERALPSADMVLAQARGSGRYVALVGAGAEQAPLLRIIDVESGATKLAETYRDYSYVSQFSSPPPRSVRLKSPDGVDFSGQLFLPTTPGAHPGLVYVHGGPQRQMFPAFHYSGYYAKDFAVNRRLAEQGYAVLAINYRSGIGYGRAFRDAPGRGWRQASEYQDVLAAGRWLAGQKGVDPQRIGIWGGSYGGLLTAQALARNSSLFKAGVAIHGVYDWSWPSPIEGHLNPSGYFGVDASDRERARAASPVSRVEGWKSPVLLFSGDADMNVDVAETVDLAERLREQKVDVRTVLVPGEAHDFIRYSTWERFWGELKSFFAETLPAPQQANLP